MSMSCQCIPACAPLRLNVCDDFVDASTASLSTKILRVLTPTLVRIRCLGVEIPQNEGRVSGFLDLGFFIVGILAT